MENDFINRKKEMERLRKLADMEKKPFIVITGRRRVGKTRLIKEFLRDRERTLYLFVEEKRGEILLEEWSREIEKGVRFDSWETLIRKATDMYEIIVIDEFQNFSRVDPSFFSTLQKLIDEGHRSMIIVLGSYMGMMKEIFEDRKSPLFGRATEIWKISPLPLRDVLNWIPGDMKSKLEIYSMFGGFPKYYVLMRQYRVKDARDAWKNLIIPKYSPLSSEPYGILLQEFGGEYRANFSIIEAVASGKQTYTEIAHHTHLSTTTLPRYLDALISLDILERRYPVTEGMRSKKARYRIKDEFIGFWFRYIFRNMHLREMEMYDELHSIIESDFPSYVGPEFEEIIREIIKGKKEYHRVGSWWNRRGDEIDIVALNEKRKEILFGEVKWRSRPVGCNILDELMEKKDLVNWHNEDRKEKFLIVSKSGFTRKCLERMDDEGIMHWDLRDVERKIIGK